MVWWTVIALLVAVFTLAYYLLARNADYFEKRNIPCLKVNPLMGSIWKAVLQQSTFADIVKEAYNVHPEAKYVGFFDFSMPVIMLKDLDLIKSITVKNFEHFPDHRNLQNEDTEPMFNKNLFALRGERWKEVRNLLSPAFTSSKMKMMYVLMRDCAKEYGNYLANLKEEESIIELKNAFTRYTNDVIATCAFGVNVNSMKDPKNKFYVLGREATNFGRWQSLKFFLVRSAPWLTDRLGISIIRPEITKFFKDLVETTIKTRDEQNIVRPDMIQLMMETRGKLGPGKELSIMDMTAQAFVFFFGGFESTSTLMCFAAYGVGVNEEIQRRLQAEIDQVLEECNGNVTYEAINEMKYLDAVIYESLRMYPAIVAADRLCMKPFELPPHLPGEKPHVVQKGDCLWIPIYGIQHDPKYFPEPEKFNPDRFNGDPKQFLNAGSLIAFGMGPRMCIGNRFALLESKVLLFHIFAKCDLIPCSKTTIPMKLSKKGFAVTAENGFWFKIQPRSNKKAGVEKIAVPGTTMLIDKIPDRYPDN
ncbi:Cytochrome P450 9e2 [Eufriesea mexicana]|uniref:Cytochrome P450 9e2 n=3 Tax=Eufriesea mexicana TaxID=516756 RepID=A0A310SAY0_9HYME|nr:Cytochrome P450 9e2 [Eufriesea mexicana]